MNFSLGLENTQPTFWHGVSSFGLGDGVFFVEKNLMASVSSEASVDSAVAVDSVLAVAAVGMASGRSMRVAELMTSLFSRLFNCAR